MSLLKDTLVIVSILFLFVIVSASLGLMYSKFSDAIQSSDVDDLSKETIGNFDSAWGGAMDWFFLALLIGLPLSAMALAQLNNIPSTYFYLVIGVLLLMVFIGWGLQGGYESIQAQDTDFSNYLANEMPVMNWIMSNFGLYSILIVLIIGWGTYVKQRNGGGISF